MQPARLAVEAEDRGTRLRAELPVRMCAAGHAHTPHGDFGNQLIVPFLDAVQDAWAAVVPAGRRRAFGRVRCPSCGGRLARAADRVAVDLAVPTDDGPVQAGAAVRCWRCASCGAVSSPPGRVEEELASAFAEALEEAGVDPRGPRRGPPEPG